MLNNTLYDALDLPVTASLEEIKEAYKRLARVYHPDRNPSEEAKLRFSQIQRAYSILKDLDSKNEYDISLGNFQEEETDDFSMEADTKNIRIDKLLNETEEEVEVQHIKRVRQETDDSLLRGFKDLLKKSDDLPSVELHTVKTKINRAPVDHNVNQAEREYQFTVNALESIMGCTRKLVVLTDGNQHSIEIIIPSNTDHQSYIRVKRPTERHSNKAPKDLRVKINISAHEYLERYGLDLILKIPLSKMLAESKDSFEVYTAKSKIKIKMPSDLSKEIKVPGHGIKDKGYNMRGDLFIRFLERDSANSMSEFDEATCLLYPIATKST